MKLEGYNVILNNNLTFRMADKDDVDLDGNPIPNDYVVFVHLNDCQVYEENGKQFFDSSSAIAIPIQYLSSWYGIGKFTNRKFLKGTEIDGKIVTEYKQASIYFAYNGKVYVGSIRSLIDE